MQQWRFIAAGKAVPRAKGGRKPRSGHPHRLDALQP